MSLFPYARRGARKQRRALALRAISVVVTLVEAPPGIPAAGPSTQRTTNSSAVSIHDSQPHWL
jgi:hypothetical protein